MRLGLILAFVPVSIGLGTGAYGKDLVGLETLTHNGNTNMEDWVQHDIPKLEWIEVDTTGSSPFRDSKDLIPPEEPLALASKHTVQSEIVKRDEKKMKSKKPFYKKYFAELLVAAGILILFVFFLCWFNISRKKRKRRARRHETVNSYAKEVVLDPQEFGNGEKKLLEDSKEPSSLPYGNSPQIV